jgi:hypothetical protein
VQPQTGIVVVGQWEDDDIADELEQNRTQNDPDWSRALNA